MRRINVDSGRPLESLAHYSRAIRINDRVFQSGTTAIDQNGLVIGDDVESQIKYILQTAYESMGAAEGNFDDVVRAHLYVNGLEHLEDATHAFRWAFGKQGLTTSVIPVSRLSREGQLIEIELEAIDGANAEARNLMASKQSFTRAFSATVVDRRILFGGLIGVGNKFDQVIANAFREIDYQLKALKVAFTDIVEVRIFTNEWVDAAAIERATTSVLGTAKPTFGITYFSKNTGGEVLTFVDVVAIQGAAGTRINTPHPSISAASAIVCVDEEIFLSPLEPTVDGGLEIANANNWAAQRDRCTENLASLLSAVDASLDDVILRRYYTAADSEMNRPYGEGPDWFAATRPAALGCKVAGYINENISITLDAHAIRGAGKQIEWRKLTP